MAHFVRVAASFTLVLGMLLQPPAAATDGAGDFAVEFGVGGGGLDSFASIYVNGRHAPPGPYSMQLYLDDEPIWSFRLDAPPTTFYAGVPFTTTEGVHTVRFVVDVFDEVAESDESNNAFLETWLFSDARPDLSLQILSARVVGIAPATFVVETRLCNVGLAATTAPARLDLWIAHEGGTLRPLFPTIMATYAQPDTLAAGACVDRTLEAQTSSLALGTYDVQVMARTDVTPYVSELAWNNNWDEAKVVATVPTPPI